MNGPDNIPGFYSYIEEKDDTVTATVDHIRSIPIFYAITNGNLYLSDNIDWIAQQLPPATSSIAETEYELTGYVSGLTQHENLFVRIFFKEIECSRECRQVFRNTTPAWKIDYWECFYHFQIMLGELPAILSS